MEIVSILRHLWYRRLLVGVVAIAAITVGLLMTYRVSLPPESREYEVGLATARILVDTPTSQVIEVNPRGSETLGPRASLLANLMAEGEVKAEIARRAGLRPKQLVAVVEGAIEPQGPPPRALRDPKVHLLTTRVIASESGSQLPIIEVGTQAPDLKGAAALASAAVGGLSDYLDSKAAVEDASDTRRLRVSGLGSPAVRAAVRGPGRLMSLAATLFIFLAGCALILGWEALARKWREASASELEDHSGEAFAFDDFATESEPHLAAVLALDPPLRDREAQAESN